MPQYNETVAFQKFRSKYEYQKQHNQIVDVSLNKTFNFLKSHASDGGSICKALNIDKSKYEKLDHPISENARIINYSKRKNAESAIVELFNAFSTYMKELLKELYRCDSRTIIHKANDTYRYADIALKFSTYDEIIEDMMKNIFRKFENERSTMKLIDKIIGHTSIVIDKNIERNAMMYLELRHLIIHNQSQIDTAYYDAYKDYISVSKTGKVPVDFLTIKNAFDAVFMFIELIDKELIKGNYVKCRV